MALYNRVKVTITAGGTGNLTLGAPVGMFQGFGDAGVPTGTVVSYVIEDAVASAWEYGRGTYTAPSTFARTTVLATNTGGTTPISAGVASILFIDALAEDFASIAVGAPISGGTNGRVLFDNGGAIGEAANLTYDGTAAVLRQLKFTGTTSGVVTLQAQAVAGTYSVTLPAALPTIGGQSLVSDTSGVLSWATDAVSAFNAAATYVTGGIVTQGGKIYSSIAGSAPAAWDATKCTEIGAAPALTSTRIGFGSGTNTLTSSADLTWNDTTKIFDVGGTAALKIPVGNATTERPATPVVGMIRYNNVSNSFEGYSGATPAWSGIGGATLTATQVGFGSATNGLTGDASLTFASSQLSTPNGTAALPSLKSTVGGTGTGIWWPAANTIAVSTNGVEAWRVNATQNLVTTKDATINGITVGTGAGTGTYNVAIGRVAMPASTGGNNTAVGDQALNANTSGNSNVAIGSAALGSNTTGSVNIAIGQAALIFNISGTQNVAIGHNALYNNKTGNDNTAFGWNSLYANVGGLRNTGLGSSTLSKATGNSSTACGYRALYLVTTGSDNSAFGVYSLTNVTTGSNNTAVGSQALSTVTVGSKNIAVGNFAGADINTGSSNVVIGSSRGTAGMNNIVIIADGDGNERVRWTSNGSMVISNKTSAQIRALTTEPAGSILYSSDDNVVAVYNGTSWQKMTTTTL